MLPEKMSTKLDHACACTSQKMCTCGLFLIEGGISGHSDENPKNQGYIFMLQFFLAKSEFA
jgi:hypothetical protein